MDHLKGMTWDHPRGYAGLEAASRLYESETGTGIAWDRRSLQEFADAPLGEIAENYDLIVLDHPHVGMIADTGSLHPLPMPDDADQASLGGSLESYIWRGQLWAYPIDAACQVAVMRPDLCDAQPLDWESLVEGTHGVPIATPLLPVDALTMMMSLVTGLGEEDIPRSPSEFCSETNGEYSLKVLKSLYRAGPAEAVAWNPIRVLEAMSTTSDFAYSPCLYGYINYARPEFREFQLEYCDLPSFRGSSVKRATLGGAGIGVSASTGHRDKAVSFARWVTSEPVQSGVYLANEGQPAHRQSWRRMGGDPRYSGFLKGSLHTIENAWTRPRNAWFLGFVDDVSDILPDFFLKDRDESSFLDEINAIDCRHREAWK